MHGGKQGVHSGHWSLVYPRDHLPHDDLPGEERRDVSPDILHQRQTEGRGTEAREETSGDFDVKCFD